MPTSVLHRAFPLALACLVALGVPVHAAFVTFESGHVRPLALSPDETRLFAVNTPDNRLEVFSVSPAGDLTHTGAVPVGLEPVAVAARSNTEVWVVNHLSDSVSVVDVGSTPPRVVRTILTCDEPRDLVFASGRAFVTAARRGQNCVGAGGAALPAALNVAGTPRAVVQVFDPANLGSSLGGTPVTAVTLFGDTPRALATDGTVVYAAVFHSGNRTTTVSEGAVCDGGAGAGSCTVFGFTMPGGLPAPNPNSCLGTPQPETGLIVEYDASSGNWEDTLARSWNNAVRFSLPDYDVFAIDATATPPVQTGTPWATVGTVLFNMAVNPSNGKVYVSNTDANNLTRFEGDRTGSCTTSTVRGHLHEARITVLDGASVLPRHLNKHLAPYGVTPSAADKAKSLATPLGMAVSADGSTLYVAAFGSSQVGVFSTAQLEANTFTPSAADHITVSGGGPSGLVVRGGRLYVATRFDNGVSVVDTATGTELAHHTTHTPEPAAVVDGRPVLYDAVLTSSNGEASCAACHVFGDFDSLAWDLGDPDIATLNNPNPIEINVGADPDFRALKGPMTTQSLRGMANHGPMHWRGDRTGGNDPGGDPLDEDAAFKKFIGAFEGLLGRSTPLGAADMQRFTDFILEVTYPPNPVRSLDNVLNASQQSGRNLYFGPITDGARTCNGCHILNPAAGFFGTDGDTSFEAEPQLFKIPHLRNMYQKVGMFGMPAVGFFKNGDNGFKGDQVRGFGFLHDGSTDTLFRFHNASVFTLTSSEVADMEQFMFAFDTNLAPAVGQQITLTSTNAATVGPRITLLLNRAAAAPVECDVVAKGNVAGAARGWVRQASGQFRSDRSVEPLLTDAALRALATTPGQELTYTCVPPGSGTRIGIDRDEDGCFDGDDPAPEDALVACGGGSTTTTTSSPTTSTSTTFPPISTFRVIPGTKLVLKDDPVDASRRRAKLTSRDATLDLGAGNGSVDDPVLGGGVLRLVSDVGFQTLHGLPATGWRYLGTPGANLGYKYTDPKGVFGPVKRVVLKAGKVLKISAGGASLAISLAADPNPVRTQLLTGTIVYCAESGGAAVYTAPKRYVAKDAPPPAFCQ